MTSVSVSLPQVTLLQPKTSAVATAVPFLKAFAPNAYDGDLLARSGAANLIKAEALGRT
jgi:hypothetical protein